MINLILFYLVFILYNGYIFIYLNKKVKEIKLSLESFDERYISLQFRQIARKLLSISIIVFLICALLLSSINYERNLSTKQLGLSLSVATFVFFTIFLLWDIIKEKLTKLLKNKLQLDINEFFQEKLSLIIIALYALILLLAVLSVISILLI